MGRRDQPADEAYEKEMDEINRQLKQEILIALIGDVNTGKSSTMNRIVGEEVAGVGAEPGETTEIKPHKYKEHIYFMDTPGLNDVNIANSEITLKYYKQADIVLFFLNVAGTVSEAEKKSFEMIQGVNTNILIVLNKIDAQMRSTVWWRGSRRRPEGAMRLRRYPHGRVRISTGANQHSGDA